MKSKIAKLLCFILLMSVFTFPVSACSSEQGTEGLRFTPIDNGAAYSVSKGNVFNRTVGNKGVERIEVTEIIIPAKYKGKPVKAISYRAFRYCEKITNVVIPSSITSIGEQAFEYCESLTNIIIPASVESIGDSAFLNCTSLNTVTISEGSRLETIGSWTFQGCEALLVINLPESVTNVGNRAFYNSLLFNNKSNNSVVYLDKWLIGYKGSIDNVIIPSDTVGIAKHALIFSEIVNITFAEGSQLKTISEGVFDSCGYLENVIISENVVSIDKEAFIYCRNLESIVIPESIISIEECAFSDSLALTKVFYGGTDSTAWDKINIDNFIYGNSIFIRTPRYYYSATKPADNPQGFWHFVDGDPTVWE